MTQATLSTNLLQVLRARRGILRPRPWLARSRQRPPVPLNTDGKESSAVIARLLQVRLDLDPAPVIVPARYAKGMLAARCAGVDGYKSRAARLAEHLKARYSGRERAYILSPTKADKLIALFDAGRDAGAITGQLTEI